MAQAPTQLRRVFPVTGGIALFVVCTVVVLAVLVDATIRSGIGNALLLAPWPLLVLWAAYVVGVASDIRADGTGMRVQNVLRRIWIPWSQVKRIAMRWQLEVTLVEGSTVSCFGGPARSRPRRIGPNRTRESATAADDGIATLQRLRMDAQGTAPDAAIRRTWDVRALSVLLILVVWAVVAIIATR